MLRARLGKLPDLEKLMAKIFTYSIKHSVKAIYFQDVSLARMKEFRTLLNCLRNIESSTIESMRALLRSGKLSSKRLIALVSTRTESENALLPDMILETVHQFDSKI